jgi:hypothetical protein
VSKYKPLKTGMDLIHVLGGGLEPHFRFLFSAIFHAFPWGVSIRVETCGSERKQIVVDLRTKFLCVWMIFGFSRGCGESHSLISSSSISRFSTIPPRSAPIRDSTLAVPAARQRHRYPGRGALAAQTLDRRYGVLPDARYERLLRLTDSTGMLQHATFTIPNYRHGYRTDDNQDDCLASDEGI